MGFTRAIYNSGTVTSEFDSSELGTKQEAYWRVEQGKLLEDENGEPYEVIEYICPEGISDTLGVWDTKNNKFIPDGYFDINTGFLWPSGSSASTEKINTWGSL